MMLQARFLLAKLNPSTTHISSDEAYSGAGEMIYTDDVSLKVRPETRSEAGLRVMLPINLLSWTIPNICFACRM